MTLAIAIAAALMTPLARKPGRGSPDEPGEREPLPVLPNYRLRHAGEFTAAGDSSPALPARRHVALAVHGSFTGAALIEVSETGGRLWSPPRRDGEPLLKSSPGAICVGALDAAGIVFVRAKCLQLVSGRMNWTLSSW